MKPPLTMQAVEALNQALAQAPELVSEDPPETGTNTRRRALVPSLEPGDLQALRLLASWRFASPAALAALAWPDRSADGQEWRMRRLVNCGMLGRRRLRFAAARHVVWARSRATELALSPPPPRPLVPPHWNEDSARHGWMRSMAVHAYTKAGWKLQLAGTQGPIVESLRTLNVWLTESGLTRLFGNGQKVFPFDLAQGVRQRDKKPLLHILLPDDPSSSLDQLLASLPYDVPRSSRIGVRFFPIDDFTYWSKSERRYVMHSARTLRMFDSLTAAQLDIPPENAGPEIPPWALLK